MPAPGKDIAGKIIDFLREKGGKAVISTGKDAGSTFDCISATLNYSLHRLMNAGVISVIGRRGKGLRQPEFVLSEEFKEGNDWRTLLGRQSGVRKEPAAVSQPSQLGGDNRSSPAILELSRELVGAYAELEKVQNELIRLREEIITLEKEKGELQVQLDAELQERKRQADELVAMDTQLHAARSRNRQVKDRIQTLEEAGLR